MRQRDHRRSLARAEQRALGLVEERVLPREAPREAGQQPRARRATRRGRRARRPRGRRAGDTRRIEARGGRRSTRSHPASRSARSPSLCERAIPLGPRSPRRRDDHGAYARRRRSVERRRAPARSRARPRVEGARRCAPPRRPSAGSKRSRRTPSRIRGFYGPRPLGPRGVSHRRPGRVPADRGGLAADGGRERGPVGGRNEAPGPEIGLEEPPALLRRDAVVGGRGAQRGEITHHRPPDEPSTRGRALEVDQRDPPRRVVRIDEDVVQVQVLREELRTVERRDRRRERVDHRAAAGRPGSRPPRSNSSSGRAGARSSVPTIAPYAASAPSNDDRRRRRRPPRGARAIDAASAEAAAPFVPLDVDDQPAEPQDVVAPVGQIAHALAPARARRRPRRSPRTRATPRTRARSRAGRRARAAGSRGLRRSGERSPAPRPSGCAASIARSQRRLSDSGPAEIGAQDREPEALRRHRTQRQRERREPGAAADAGVTRERRTRQPREVEERDRRDAPGGRSVDDQVIGQEVGMEEPRGVEGAQRRCRCPSPTTVAPARTRP